MTIQIRESVALPQNARNHKRAFGGLYCRQIAVAVRRQAGEIAISWLRWPLRQFSKRLNTIYAETAVCTPLCCEVQSAFVGTASGRLTFGKAAQQFNQKLIFHRTHNKLNVRLTN